MAFWSSFTGKVIAIHLFPTSARKTDGCTKRYTVQGKGREIVNFIVSPQTQFLGTEPVNIGDAIVGFHLSDAPVPLIYPPQYRAVYMIKQKAGQSVKADTFDRQMISSDKTLKLNIARDTNIILTNGQPFRGKLTNRFLIVIYSLATKSIPAQTTPETVIVVCGEE